MLRLVRTMSCIVLALGFLTAASVGLFSAGAASAVAARSAISVQPVANLGPTGTRLAGQSLEYSTNWSGYSATSTKSGAFTSVTASWTQPTLTCASQTSYVAFWAGLDGNGSATVEQTGTLGECEGGVASYSAWYEMYPGALVYLPEAVKAGDSLTSTVTTNGSGSFTLSLDDTSWSSPATETLTLTSAKLVSAEAIAEAPSSGNQVLPLANFGTVTFTDVTVNGAAIGTTSPLDEIDMVSNTGQAEATPSSLTSGGETFSVADVEPTTPSQPSPPSHGHGRGSGNF